MDYNKISSILERYRILLYNSLANEEIKSSVAKYGYDETKLKQGIALHKETTKLLLIREKCLNDQVNTTLMFNSEYIRAKELLKKVVLLARRLFIEIPGGTELIPVTLSISEFDTWKATVLILYKGILNSPLLLSKLAKYGYTEEVFRREIESIVSLEKLIKMQKHKIADLQDKTTLRNQKLKELQDFCNAYQEIIVTALSHQPMLLDKIGIKVLKKYISALKPPKAPAVRKYKKRTPKKQ
jgi:hypothetical protein